MEILGVDLLAWPRKQLIKYWDPIKAILTVFLIIIWIIPPFGKWLTVSVGVDFPIAYSVVYIAAYLWFIERQTKETWHNSQHKLTKENLQEILKSYREDNTATEKVTLVLFSGFHEVEMVTDLFKHFKKITLYLQYPEPSIKTWRGWEGKADLFPFLSKLSAISQQYKDVDFKLYLNKYRASYKAMSIDDKLLVLSWYTFQSSGNFSQNGDTKEEVIRGSGYPHIRFVSPSNDYVFANQMFEEILGYLSHDAIGPISPEQLKAFIEANINKLPLPF